MARDKTLLNTEARSLRAFWNEHSEWSQKTFGADSERGPVGPLRHLLKEAQEALNNPSDLLEYVDCLFLVFDAARRAGYSYDEFVTACFDKLEVNKKREWIRNTEPDQPTEHTR